MVDLDFDFDLLTFWLDVTNTTCSVGGIGVALNGVYIYSQSDGSSECADAIESEGPTFELCGGHADFDGLKDFGFSFLFIV